MIQLLRPVEISGTNSEIFQRVATPKEGPASEEAGYKHRPRTTPLL
jgi:hypothetical protein